MQIKIIQFQSKVTQDTFKNLTKQGEFYAIRYVRDYIS